MYFLPLSLHVYALLLGSQDALSVYDLDAVMRAINLLADDLEMVAVWRIHPAPVSTVAGS